MSSPMPHQDAIPAGIEEAYQIECFLKREARLLDAERYDEWLAMLAEDIHYWMPSIESRRRANDGGATYLPGRMAYFDDYLEHLQKRVARFKQPSAWAEDPPTRHIHVIANIEVFAGETEGEYAVYSTFVNYRSRVETDNDLLIGRRSDIIRRTPGGLRLARRKVVITQTLLQSKNLNTFF